MDKLNESIAGWINGFSLSMITDRSWFEIASILTPSIILILVLFGFSFTLQNRKWKIVTYTVCLLLTLLFLPYELFRQSAALSKAQTNISEMQTRLKGLLNASELNHIENLADKEVASSMLEETIDNLEQKEKKELILISWLIAENEKQSLRLHEDKQKLFFDEIKSSLNEAKGEIINTREPVDKISDDILKRIDSDISHLIGNKMQSLNQAFDHSLKTFQQEINFFVQNEFKTYEERLATLTQRSIDELRNYTSKAGQELDNKIRDIDRESSHKLDETQKSIDHLEGAVENINMDKIVAHIKQLSGSIDLIQKQSDVQFEYNECIRTVGWIDLIGREEECKKKLYMNMNDLINQ
ncbi:hypothetical protein [Nitrosomonas sp. Nm58]|uniref:hypothetical protein n=1 Tax=Nitrosomonas sp. Nm58 TaxID=200126 RepID=UPI0008943565|nr:hypothetical protein [Nitrosomonas sp. Nm58]SDY48716.1 hypothetical protein SAMN05421754_10113 [Nitrosomonas sp. Nm58]